MVRARLPAIVSLLLAACARQEPERVAIAVAPLPSLGLVFIADASGYFAARGLEVEQRVFETGREALVALAAGEVDAATAYTTPVVLRARKGDLEVLTTLHASTRLTRLVARADRGIRGASDLAGRRVGVPHGTSGEFFLHTLLAFAGTEQSVAVVDLSPVAAVKALGAGEVDAIATWPPYVYEARRVLDGGRAVEMPSEVYTEISALVTRGTIHRTRRAALVKLVRALADAERLVQERPDVAFRALRARFSDVEEERLRDTWSSMRLSLGMTHELAAVVEREAAWLREGGHLDGPPLDVGALLAPDVLAEVDPEAVTFVSPSRRGRGD
jgi:ABC-type nitrate/sulfonate/bicarbonate transport system substrate-binding protein